MDNPTNLSNWNVYGYVQVYEWEINQSLSISDMACGEVLIPWEEHMGFIAGKIYGKDTIKKLIEETILKAITNSILTTVSYQVLLEY